MTFISLVKSIGFQRYLVLKKNKNKILAALSSTTATDGPCRSVSDIIYPSTSRRVSILVINSTGYFTHFSTRVGNQSLRVRVRVSANGFSASASFALSFHYSASQTFWPKITTNSFSVTVLFIYFTFVI